MKTDKELQREIDWAYSMYVRDSERRDKLQSTLSSVENTVRELNKKLAYYDSLVQKLEKQLVEKP